MCTMQKLQSFGLIFDYIKVVAMSLKSEIRLHAHRVGTNTRSGTKAISHSSDWLMHSELGYFVRSLISGLNDGAVTFIQSHVKGTDDQHMYNTCIMCIVSFHSVLLTIRC